MRARGPDLLTVDDPVVAASLRTCAKPRDSGTAGWLGEQLAPDLLARRQWRQVFALLLLGSERHHGRPAHAVADDEQPRELAERALLLLPDHALDRGGATATIFLWPMQAGPAGFRLLFLPGPGDIEDVGALEPDAAERGLAQLFLILLRRIRGDPGLRLATERGLLRGVVEVHLCLPCHSGRAKREPGISFTNFWIPRCAIAHLWSAPPAHPGTTTRKLGRVLLAHVVDQRVLPIGLAAETERERIGAAVIHVAVELPGEAHAAMDLDVVLGAMLERLGRADARGRSRLRQLAGIGRKRPGAVIAIGARQGRRDIHICEHVLDRLERADRPAEGDAVERVVAAHLKRAVGAPELLEGDQHRGTVEHLRDHAKTFAGAAERLGLGALEGDLGLPAGRIDIGEVLDLDAVCLHVHEEQGNVAFPAARTRACDDHSEVRDRAIGDRLLDAVERAAAGAE